MNPLAAVFGAPGETAGLMTRLRWRLQGGAAAAACAAARRQALSGEHEAAAQILRRAQAGCPDDPELAFVVAALARYGFTPRAEAESLLGGLLARPVRPGLRAAARRALLELVWERGGTAADLAAHARAILAEPRATAAWTLRAAAALVAADCADEAAEAALGLRRRAPGVLARAGYLELLLALRARRVRGLRRSETAARVADALAAAEGLFDRMVAEDPGGVALVANGPGLAGRGLGPVIDRRRLVVRFNAFPDDPADHGRRADVWMRPHDDAHVPLRAPPGLRLVVATGCDLRFRFADATQRLERLRGLGAALTTVPPGLYRRLFARLEAAPSVGLIGLAWAAEAAGGRLDAGSAFGYALHRNSQSVSRYHDRIVVGRRPGRHNWPAEHAMHQTLLSGPEPAA